MIKTLCACLSEGTLDLAGVSGQAATTAVKPILITERETEQWRYIWPVFRSRKILSVPFYST